MNPGRCTRDRRHACAPAQSGFCPALCRLTTRTTRPAKRFCSKTVIVNPLVVYKHTHTHSAMEYETKQKSYQRAVRIDNRPQTTKTAPLHARTHTHTHFQRMKNKRNTQIYKRNTSKHGLSRQRKQMSFFASSLYFFITHSYFEQTRKKKTLLSSNV